MCQKVFEHLLFTMLLITMIAVMIDYFERVDKFINADLSFKGNRIGLLPSFCAVDQWLALAFIYYWLSYFLSRMAKNSEIISIKRQGEIC
ncbi:MAG: hypothetical protein U0T36_04745 [Saprospiraceae bacterium]